MMKLACPGTDPFNRCRYVTEHGRLKKICDCQNTGPVLCPQSKLVHSYGNMIYRYPARFADRAHCVKVWDFLSRNERKNEEFASRE
jgi:hypothetical protein